jgi:L-iditol 2-dehydrogenase
MLAAISSGGRIEIGELPTPQTGPADALVKVRAVGVCETDVTITLGTSESSKQRLLGHEWSGTVEDSPIEDMNSGDRVVGEGMIACGTCPMCASNRINLCESYEEIGFSLPGAYAEFLSIPARNLHRLPPGISFEEGALVEPTAVAVHALQLAEVGVGDSVAVLGPGPIGLLALQAAKAMGADRVALTGTRDNRLAIGESLGADMTVNVNDEDPVEVLRREMGGGPEIVIDAAGTTSSFEQAINLTAKGGSIVLVSGWNQVTWSPGIIIGKELILRGSLASPGAWPMAIDLIESGKVRVKPIITHRFPLPDIPRAFDLVHRRGDGIVKAVILL